MQGFAHADEAHRHWPRFGDGGNDAAFGGAIQFGDDQAGKPQRIIEGFDLHYRILAGVGVQHQHHLVRRSGIGLGDDAFYFFDFFHEMQLCRQTAGGISEHDVDAACFSRAHRIENNRGGIARFLANHRDVIALAPGHQLLARRGAEGVARRQQHRLALGLEVLCQLADGGGFAGAVHARHHDHEGFVRTGVEWLLQRCEQIDQRLLQRVFELHGIGERITLYARAQAVQQGLGRIHTHVGAKENSFEFFIQCGVDFCATTEEFGDRGIEHIARFGQPAQQAFAPGRGLIRQGFWLGFGFKETKHAYVWSDSNV